MTGDYEARAGVILDRSWLEEIGGRTPVLLLAPHGGRADPKARRLVNPKVNDLHTAEITRELARHIGASALINSALDRNRVDLNRMAQLVAHAPWFLELIAQRVRAIVERHGRAIVLLIHGWNVIAPRLDIGIGVRRHGGELRPAGLARVSASDDFINGPLAHLGRSLAARDIPATFGLPYPAGGAQNLLQAFTDRHLESPLPTLRELSALAARGAIEAAQLELSVALRLPGGPRERCIAAMVESFGDTGRGDSAPVLPHLRVVRTPDIRSALPAKRPPTAAPASRVGIECFAPDARVGAMASFDLGPGGVGARIMLLLPEGRVALFTNEGKTRLKGARASLGPLVFEARGRRLALRFRGAMVTVPDATSYLVLERALSSARLDESAEVELELDPYPGEAEPQAFFREHAGQWDPVATSAFGRLAGEIRADGFRCALGGFGRAGLSFTSLGTMRFTSRRMLWACFGEGSWPLALEIRTHADADATEHASVRVLNSRGWSAFDTVRVELETRSPAAPPEHLSATFAGDGVSAHKLVGEVENFVPLSRPGPANTRVFTSLGFARFRLGAREGGGLFEYSRRDDLATQAPTRQ
jgi:hypothetical protein